MNRNQKISRGVFILLGTMIVLGGCGANNNKNETKKEVPSESSVEKKEVELKVGNWEKTNYAALKTAISEHGTLSEDYQKSPKPYAVFDWDNTTIINDIGEAVLTYQLMNLRFKMNPTELETALKTNIPADDFKEEWNNKAGGAVNIEKIAADIGSSYQVLYQNYEGLAGNQSLEEVKKFPEYVDFSSKLRYLYEAIGSSFSSDISYPWVTYLVSGMTSKEVQDLSQEAADYWLEQELGEETWTSPADLKGQAGELAVTFKIGIRTVPEMQDLYQTLMANGIDVYVCSASFIDVIVPFATHAKYGYQVPKEQVYAMELKKNAEGIIQAEMDPDYDQTQGKGKTDTIIKFIAPKHENVTPILVAGDSNGDVAMLSDFPDLQVGLIFNRVKDGGIGKLAKEATESAGNKDQRYFLQGRDENKGQLIPSSKSILLGETEEKLLNVAK